MTSKTPKKRKRYSGIHWAVIDRTNTYWPEVFSWREDAVNEKNSTVLIDAKWVVKRVRVTEIRDSSKQKRGKA